MHGLLTSTSVLACRQADRPRTLTTRKHGTATTHLHQKWEDTHRVGGPTFTGVRSVLVAVSVSTGSMLDPTSRLGMDTTT